MIRTLVCVLVGSMCGAQVARAEPIVVPLPPRVLHIPTAYLQPPLHVYSTAGGTQRLGAFVALSTGLGRLAEIDIELSDNLGECVECSDGDPTADSRITPSAMFKTGLAENEFSRFQPALALGFRTTLGEPGGDTFDSVRVARLFAALSKQIGGLQIHAGVDLWDAEVTVGDQVSVLHDQPLSERVRPFAGISFTPPQFPRTRFIADFSWVPVVDQGRADLRWVGGWGARYQALTRTSVELGVRHREGDKLDDATVMLRLNLILPGP